MSPLFLLIRIERQVGKMSRKEESEQKPEALLSPIVESNGFELVDVEYVKEAGNCIFAATLTNQAESQ